MNLNQVTIPVSNLQTSIDFYTKIGLKLIVHSNDHYARFECPDGEATFSIHASSSFPKESGIWIYFEIANLDGKVNELVQKGIKIDEMPVDQNWLWREAQLKDPDGHQLILFYAGKNRKNPPWRIN